jgi:hypothetical protein
VTHRLIPLALALALVAAPFLAREARADGELEQVLVESAATPAQHAALARYYQDKGAAASKEAERHRAMGKSYGGAKVAEVSRMREHCEKLAALYEDQAKQFDMLAKEHQSLAK